MDVGRIFLGNLLLLSLFQCCISQYYVNGQSSPSTSSSISEEVEFMQHILTCMDYDKRIRPHFNEGRPTVVDVDISLNDMSPINDITMDFSVDFFLRQRWEEPRLVYNTSSNTNMITLSYEQVHFFWVPDSYVTKEKMAFLHTVSVPNMLLRISPQGAVLFSQRIAATVKCKLKYSKYPMDSQTCRIQLESFAHTRDEIVLRWFGESVEYSTELSDGIPNFDITKVSAGNCTSIYSTGSYSCLYVDIYLKRNLLSYMLHMYIPTTLVVLMSFVSCWLDPTAVPARTSLSIASLLVITMQAITYQERTPMVSYIRALDVWLLMCIIFVAASALEFATVNTMLERDKRKLAKRQGREARRNRHTSKKTNQENVELDDTSDTDVSVPKRTRTPGKRARQIDIVARFVTILGFLAFIILYWMSYVDS